MENEAQKGRSDVKKRSRRKKAHSDVAKEGIKGV